MACRERVLTPCSCCRKVAIVLEELGLEYQPIYLDFQKGEHKAPEHTQYNPNGRIPSLIDHKNNNFTIWFVFWCMRSQSNANSWCPGSRMRLCNTLLRSTTLSTRSQSRALKRRCSSSNGFSSRRRVKGAYQAFGSELCILTTAFAGRTSARLSGS